MSKFKTTTLIAAIGMTIYLCYIIIRRILSEYGHYFDFSSEVYRNVFYAAWMYLIFGSVISTIIAILGQYPTEPIVPKKSFRIITYILTVLSFIWAIGALLPYLYMLEACHIYIFVSL